MSARPFGGFVLPKLVWSMKADPRAAAVLVNELDSSILECRAYLADGLLSSAKLTVDCLKTSHGWLRDAGLLRQISLRPREQRTSCFYLACRRQRLLPVIEFLLTLGLHSDRISVNRQEPEHLICEGQGRIM
jgi:hypothetical protein